MIKDPEIEKMLKDHYLWLESGYTLGKRATFANCVLQGIDFSKAFLRGVNFVNVNLRDANLTDSNLKGACFEKTDLTNAHMSDSDFANARFDYCLLDYTHFERSNLSRVCMRYATVKNCDFGSAILQKSDLSQSEFHDTNFSFADITNAFFTCSVFDNVNFFGATMYKTHFDSSQFSDEKGYEAFQHYSDLHLHCPSHGSFIGWKKVNCKIVKLEIPEDALRSSSTSEKCRCSKAKVLAIEELDGAPSGLDVVINRRYDHNTVYHVGRTVYPDGFDEKWWNECSNGIHFFIDRESAVRY